ncbi:MAG: asparagine synthase (glutamine-hydrolyzing), partial [Chloroflexi bacterium]|nr:asparagine synthase (glutamine-hydrolyzing) [Chloroflexota bacterium]
MCGITGFIDGTRGRSQAELAEIASRMAARILHRGPDDGGVWTDQAAGIALGFRRLAILDLSPTGHQPMFSRDNRLVIIFNGEIYNYQELRRELEAGGCQFQGTSDTEVMLAAIREWGIPKTVQLLNGMFAFALWDCAEHTLTLGRDRLGIKPLYYGWAGETFLFGSEPGVFVSHPDFAPTINRTALSRLLQYNYIPAPHSIYADVFKLPPASTLTIRASQPGSRPEPVAYWSAAEMAAEALANPFRGSPEEAVDALDEILRRSVRERMVADVPLGAFLSSGIDSSAIVALMQAQSSAPVRTFTIGFEQAEFNEADYARAIAGQLGTQHTEVTVTAQEMRDVIPSLPHMFSEPFADSSQIPTYLVSRIARQQVTVSLSGDGGDELFAGYNRYRWTNSAWRWMSRYPAGARRALSSWGQKISPAGWNRAFHALRPLTPPALRVSEQAEKWRKVLDVMGASSLEAAYHGMVTFWKDAPTRVPGPLGLADERLDPDFIAQLNDPVSQMMFMDLVTYLPDDILVKLDRAAMYASLEGRVPFLDDHRVVSFAWRLPIGYKLHPEGSKWALRRVLQRYLPDY